jgi:GNAT superfamily N-acetyltransferase
VQGAAERQGELAAALNRALVWRACPADSRSELPGGWSTRLPQAPLVHHVNAVRLAQCPSAEALEQLAGRMQAGLAFRHVVIEEAGPAERLAHELEGRGWSRERVVLMALEGHVALRDADARAREIDEAAMIALQRRIFEQENVGSRADPELPAQMCVAEAAMRAAGDCRRFAAGDGVDGAPVSMATLYLDPDVDGERVALVESVATLRNWRQQGLGHAVVGAAMRAARDWGAALVAIATDADDWPQVWYAGLGFEPVRHHVGYVRTATAEVPGG